MKDTWLIGLINRKTYLFRFVLVCTMGVTIGLLFVNVFLLLVVKMWYKIVFKKLLSRADVTAKVRLLVFVYDWIFEKDTL